MEKIPNITDSELQRLIRRDFSESEFNAVARLLALYISDDGNRVRASILKLSDGDISFVKKYVEQANYDYRDVLALSEYPNYSERAFDDDLTEEMENQLMDLDWTQYQDWLRKD